MRAVVSSGRQLGAGDTERMSEGLRLFYVFDFLIEKYTNIIITIF